jgi:hypothetical protein
MLTNEAIEVHLESLRARQDELRKDLRELRAEDQSIRDRIDTVCATLRQRIDAIDERLTRQIDKLNMNR